MANLSLSCTNRNAVPAMVRARSLFGVRVKTVLRDVTIRCSFMGEEREM